VDSYPSVAIESVTDSSRYFVLRIQDGSGEWQAGAGAGDPAVLPWSPYSWLAVSLVSEVGFGRGANLALFPAGPSGEGTAPLEGGGGRGPCTRNEG